VTDAVSVFGDPDAQLLFETAPRLPFAGPVTIEKLRSHCWASDPESPIAFGVSSFIESETAFAVGAVLAE
jgi:hypothetical protein